MTKVPKSELPADYRKQFDEQLIEIRKNRNASAVDLPVFHYTSPDSFLGIVSTGEMWLTHALYLNDVNELSYSVRLLRTLINARLGGQPERRHRTLLESLIGHEVETPQLTETDRGILAAILEKTSDRTFDHWYLASFSLEPNKLSQWRAYCPLGGYAIGFKTTALAEKFGKNYAFQLGEVSYNQDAQAEHLRTMLDGHLGFARSLRDRYPEIPIETHIDKCASFSAVTLSLEMLLFKSPAFQEEREWRLLLPEFAAKDFLKFHCKNGILKPYVPIDFKVGGKLPLERVMVGPLGDQGLLRRSAELLLRINDYPAYVDSVDYRIR